MHARAAVERWSEEVRILECEMVAVVRWFEARATQWSAGSDASGSPGFRAYACRQFSLYQVFAECAISEFKSVVGGAEKWYAMWDGRHFEQEAHLSGGASDGDMDVEIVPSAL